MTNARSAARALERGNFQEAGVCLANASRALEDVQKLRGAAL